MRAVRPRSPLREVARRGAAFAACPDVGNVHGDCRLVDGVNGLLGYHEELAGRLPVSATT